ncbi:MULTISPECIES: hypothetical protein [unclassified Mesorhizobium]|uniref:hypothetical protein n=1 Tax=unclassified Mesorhizobium TaxID=325217 RepID=UPI0015E2AC0C|nr:MULTISPECIES: hypothetical protein [unclassified Mesorhizobium]MCA0027325.1 hypothetical protein [Mesorhizobium sp. B263B1A]
MKKAIHLAVAAVIFLSGCATNHYDLAAQPDYRDTLNNPNDRYSGTAGKHGG